MSRIRLVIFDLDGTLVDACRAVFLSLNHALKQKDYAPLDRGTIKRSVGWGDRNLIARFVKSEDVEGVLKIYRRHHKISLIRHVRLLPGALTVLKLLKKANMRLAIASNRPTVFTRIILRTLKVENYFDYILCADRVRRPKPAPDILNTILKRSACPRRETLYVGDMAIDAEAGNRARIRTVIVLTGSSSYKDVASFKPFKILRRTTELRHIFIDS